MNYELLVIGNERDGIEAALAAAQQGRRVALVETAKDTTTIEVLREAAQQVVDAGTVTMQSLRSEVARIQRCRLVADRAELTCLGVDIYSGVAHFVDATTVKVELEHTDQVRETPGETQTTETLCAEKILLACGATSVRPAHVRLDGRNILDAESLLALEELPYTVIVVGAGQTGMDYAILLASLGVEVTVIDERANGFDVCGGLMEDRRWIEAQSLEIAFRLGDEVIGTETRADLNAVVRLASGKTIAADAVVFCIGRVGATSELNLGAVGVGVDERGRVWCDADGRTWASSIYATGEVVGFRPSDSRLSA